MIDCIESADRQVESHAVTERRRPHLLITILTIACIGSAPASAAPDSAPNSAKVFTDQAGKFGAQKCAGLYSALGDLVSRGAAYSVRTEANREAPDAHIIQGAVGMTYNLPELKGQAAGMVFAAPVAQGCEGQLVRVAPLQRSCQQVIKELPAGSAATANLSGVPLYQLGGNRGQVLMIASGAGCVVVTVNMASQKL